MSNIINFIKKEKMFSLSVFVAIISLFITKPSTKLLESIDFKTLCTLFMLLSVLEGFKQEKLFDPFIKLAYKIKSICLLTLFLVFCVFFASCFVTNDVSLIIFVPITIILFRAGNKEKYIVPTLVLENIAAVRGSLLTPFGSPQNLFLFTQSKIDPISFMSMMLPLFIFSALLLVLFILFMYRRDLKEKIDYSLDSENKEVNKKNKILYLLLFILVIYTILSKTTYWPYITLLIIFILLVFDRKIFKKIDYILILTFLCFFIFSSSIANNEMIASFLNKYVSNNEYIWSLGLSQIISNVPASIVLWPFTSNLKALLYGLDSAGLISVIGSLASVINMRLYTKEYKDGSKLFMIEFEKISLLFFIIVNFFQLYLMNI